MTSTPDIPFDPVERIGGAAGTAFVILCDHASNALPETHCSLGLPHAQLARHIGYDIGAADVTRRLASKLDAGAVLSRFSRLLIDPNRGEDDPTLVMRLSDGAVVPGNARIDAAEIDRRLERYHRPYHRAVTEVLDGLVARGRVPVVVSIHSFTPVWRGTPRPWQAAILWDRDPRLARPLLSGLRAEAGLTVGDNEPYDGALRGDCLHRHGTLRGFPHALVEIRQDLIADADGADEWAERLARLLTPLAEETALRRVEMFGSRTDAAAGGLDPATRTELEAEVLRRLVAHLRARTDVQNIDLMNLAGFCRNCLSNWLADAAARRGLPLSKDEARREIYGMAHESWKALYQTEAGANAQRLFAEAAPAHVDDGRDA